jgi:peptidoglycan/LPS O-acetylase OafA/YrhL
LIAYAVFAAAFALREMIETLPRLFRWPFARLADISYPLYVVHGILGYSIIAASLQAGLAAGLSIVLAITGVVALAALLHVAVERPSQALGKSLAKRSNATAQAAHAPRSQ